MTITREEALKRWKGAMATKQRITERLERLVRNSCLEHTGKEPAGIEIW